MYLLWLALALQVWLWRARALEVARKSSTRVKPHRKLSWKRLSVGIMTVAHVQPDTCCLCVGHKPPAQLGHLGEEGPQLSREPTHWQVWGGCQTLKLGPKDSGAMVI